MVLEEWKFGEVRGKGFAWELRVQGIEAHRSHCLIRDHHFSRTREYFFRFSSQWMVFLVEKVPERAA